MSKFYLWKDLFVHLEGFVIGCVVNCYYINSVKFNALQIRIIKEKAVFKLYNKCDHSSIWSIKRYRQIKLYKPKGQDKRGTHLIDIKNV